MVHGAIIISTFVVALVGLFSGFNFLTPSPTQIKKTKTKTKTNRLA